MAVHEFTFGKTACEIHVQAKPNAAGTGVPVQHGVPYVWEDNGSALRGLANRDGQRIHYASSSEDATVAFLARYLEERFGPQGNPPQRQKGSEQVRPILEPPLIDDRPK